MDLNSALNQVMEYDIKDHCHVNTNEDGDRFVGIKVDSDNAMVYFPIGYDLPQTDKEIRKDIKNLIHVLSEFTTKEDRLIAVNRFAAPQAVDFPINAFRGVIEYFLGNGYYIETEPAYTMAAKGNQNWPRTLRQVTPLIQTKNGVSSPIYTEFVVRKQNPNANKEITQINRFCVYEAFKRLGWLYIPSMPEDPGPHPDVKTSIVIVRDLPKIHRSCRAVRHGRVLARCHQHAT